MAIDEIMKVGVLKYFKTVIEERIAIESQKGEVFKGVEIRAEERFVTTRTFSKFLGLEKEFREILEKEMIQKLENKYDLAG